MNAGLTFGQRLDATLLEFGHLCVGIDPHPYLFDRWNVADSPEGLREFSLRVLDACLGTVGMIKPQVAFFERWGARGFSALELLIDRARAAGILVIADPKRGDIGSTMQAYTATWLASPSPLESDAVTVSPYLGLATLSETIASGATHGKGTFVLAATSNPEALHLQTSVYVDGESEGRTVARSVLDFVHQANQGPAGVSAGVVIGATVRLEEFGIDADAYPGLPVLAPGFGFQGADPAHARALFGDLTTRLIVTETRSILEAGLDGIDEVLTRRATYVQEAFS